MVARCRRAVAHSQPGHSAGLHRGLDLPAAQRPPAGDRHGCARPQPVPLSPRLARAEGRGQVRAAGSLRPRAAAHPGPGRARSGAGYPATRRSADAAAVLAAIVRLLDTTFLRVGNEEIRREQRLVRPDHAARAARGGAGQRAHAALSRQERRDARRDAGRSARRARRARAASSCRGRSCSSTWTKPARCAASRRPTSTTTCAKPPAPRASAPRTSAPGTARCRRWS